MPLPFPRIMSARWQVSTAAGVSPVWGRDGRELLYYQNGAIVRVPFGGGSTAFRAGTPVRVLRVDLPVTAWVLPLMCLPMGDAS